MVYPALLPLMRTPRLPVVDWTDAPADLNGLVRFAERQNLVSARVPSHFRRSLPTEYKGRWAPHWVCTLWLTWTSLVAGRPTRTKGEGKVSLSVGKRGIATLILNLDTGWRWVVSFTPRPFCSGLRTYYEQENFVMDRDLVPLYLMLVTLQFCHNY